MNSAPNHHQEMIQIQPTTTTVYDEPRELWYYHHYHWTNWYWFIMMILSIYLSISYIDSYDDDDDEHVFFCCQNKSFQHLKTGLTTRKKIYIKNWGHFQWRYEGEGERKKISSPDHRFFLYIEKKPWKSNRILNQKYWKITTSMFVHLDEKIYSNPGWQKTHTDRCWRRARANSCWY